MIETARLKLIPCEQKHCEAILEGEQYISDLLKVEPAKNWLIFPESIHYVLKMLEDNPHSAKWGMHFFIHKADNKLVGVGGYKGVADENGMVEIGYSIAPSYENQGLATETAQSLIDHAFAKDFIRSIDAHTLAEENASCRILQKCGMTKIAEKHDEEDGDIWHWRITRHEFEKRRAKI